MFFFEKLLLNTLPLFFAICFFLPVF